jgi:tRNA (guanine37-N1)-methyltransferase
VILTSDVDLLTRIAAWTSVPRLGARLASLGVRIDVITIFPGLIVDFAAEALLGKAQSAGLVTVAAHDPRDFTTDRHRTVDDSPFGGGAGMVMKAEPIARCIEERDVQRPVFALTAGGDRFDQARARALATSQGFSLLCGRYEGIDQRVIDSHCAGELSIGDFVLAGGEVAAITIIEAVTRLVPGVMGNDISGITESYSDWLLEEPQYTRPAVWRDRAVPSVLTSGDHAQVAAWRLAAALIRTRRRRPSVMAERALSATERLALARFESSFDDVSDSDSDG